MNIRLYNNLFLDNTAAQTIQIMYFLKGEAEEVLYYPMNIPSNNVLIQDASGNNNHVYSGTANNPVMNSSPDDGLKFGFKA